MAVTEVSMKKPPTHAQLDNPEREQPGQPNYMDESADRPETKKGAPFNPFEDQPQYINWKARYGEYR